MTSSPTFSVQTPAFDALIIGGGVIGSSGIVTGVVAASDLSGKLDLRDRAEEHPYVVAGVMGILTLIGVLFQARNVFGDDEEEEEKKKAKKKD